MDETEAGSGHEPLIRYLARCTEVEKEIMHKGSCLCGAVSFEVEGPLPAADACHCTRCRKVSGHFWASTDVKERALTLHGEEHLRWYASSEKVRRGFCSTCGASMFWNPIERSTIAIAMGAFDEGTSTKLGLHIHVSSKGDYYEIEDGLPQNEN